MGAAIAHISKEEDSWDALFCKFIFFFHESKRNVISGNPTWSVYLDTEYHPVHKGQSPNQIVVSDNYRKCIYFMALYYPQIIIFSCPSYSSAKLPLLASCFSNDHKKNTEIT